jgi:hypothetical protein
MLNLPHKLYTLLHALRTRRLAHNTSYFTASFTTNLSSNLSCKLHHKSIHVGETAPRRARISYFILTLLTLLTVPHLCRRDSAEASTRQFFFTTNLALILLILLTLLTLLTVPHICAGETAAEEGKHKRTLAAQLSSLTYKGSPFHRIIPNFMIQATTKNKKTSFFLFKKNLYRLLAAVLAFLD